MRICKRTICAVLVCGMGFPIIAPVAVGQQPEGDVQALLASLAEALDAESTRFAIPPALYRFGRRSFELKTVREIEIEGQGATFMFALRGGRVRLESCQSVTVKNLFLDIEHPPFIQGTIQAIDRAVLAGGN
jgi:hypothetical protein